MPELTKNQSPLAPFYGGTGGTGWDGYQVAFKTSDGKMILPPNAALHGSGSYQGNSPYDNRVACVGGFDRVNYWPGTFDTYRRQGAHPTLALAMASVKSPVESAGVSIEADDGSDTMREMIETHVLPMVPALIKDCLRALDFGFQAFELIWNDADGFRVVTRPKPLTPDRTFFKVDDHGNVVAIQNGGDELTLDRALVFTYDGQNGNPYGRSRYENCRRTWCNYLAIEDQLYKLTQKTAGITGKVGYPPDMAALLPGDTGNEGRAQTIARGLREGQWITYPNFGGLRVDDPKEAADLAKSTMFPIDVIQMGDTGGAQGATLETLNYYDKLMCRALLRSERSVIEASGGGTRAESDNMTANISDTDCDQIHAAIVDAINKQLIDPVLVENFGEDAAGTVRLRINEIVDENAIIDRKILDAMLSNPDAFAQLYEHLDKPAFVQRMGLKVNDQPWEDTLPMAAQPADAGGLEGKLSEDEHESDTNAA